MNEAQQQTVFSHLTPLESPAWGEGTLYCDLCYASETEDIMNAVGLQASFEATLRPMYHDQRDDCVICQKCAESGMYLEEEI